MKTISYLHTSQREEIRPSVEPSKVAYWRDNSWRYVPANETDIRRTFARYGFQARSK